MNKQLIVRNKKPQRQPLPPPAWEKQLEDLREEVRNTLSSMEERFQKLLGDLQNEADRRVRDAVKKLPKSQTDLAATLEALREAVQELANDFDRALNK